MSLIAPKQRGFFPVGAPGAAALIASLGRAVPPLNVAILLRASGWIGRTTVNAIDGVAVGVTTPGVKLSNAVDTAGVVTTVGLTLTAGLDSPSTAGSAAAVLSPYFIAGDLQNSWYVSTQIGGFSITGLEAGKKRKFIFTGSRDVPSPDVTRFTTIAITAGTITDGGAAARTYAAARPASGVEQPSVEFDIVPGPDGVVSFNLLRDAANTTGFAYLSGIFIR